MQHCESAVELVATEAAPFSLKTEIQEITKIHLKGTAFNIHGIREVVKLYIYTLEIETS